MMHDARQAFIKSESAKKLRQALWHQVRTSSEVRYVADDKVLQVMNRQLFYLFSLFNSLFKLDYT